MIRWIQTLGALANDELCEKKIRMCDEIDKQVNHVPSLIQETTNDHIDESMSFEKIFEDGLLLLDELDRHIFPIGFFDKSFEERLNDELKFLVTDQACSRESDDNNIGLSINAVRVSPLSEESGRRKGQRKRE